MNTNTTILTVTGSAGAGKTTCLQAMVNAFDGAYVLVPRGGVVKAKTAILAACHKDRLYVDIEGQPTPTLLDFIKNAAHKRGVRHLVIAHS